MAKSTNKPHDFLDHILNHPYNQKLPFIAKIKKAVKRVEKYAGLNASQHLGFIGESRIKGKVYLKYSDKPDETGEGEGFQYLGEWSKNTNKMHGRGVNIFEDGDI